MDMTKTIVITALLKFTRYNKKNIIFLEFLYTYLPVKKEAWTDEEQYHYL